ncbi:MULTISPECIES: hypothetical protein [unclassified Arthrobacter]|uniref:hypothetical protein n=1 Tax=unclassified Arthrobacter TaxID=235627 RepID=UPI001C860310|nr:hypothetical protein [Arthrobacter sp. MAHUQ-56]MBX7444985.1 hypothetical protein [Arthrobacter sp. MAHUQ-56]
MPRTTPKPVLLLLSLPLLLSACAAPAAPPGAQLSASTPHGYVAGAQENPEPQAGLLTLNAGTGEGQLLSLLTEEASDAGTYGPVTAAQVDGRYALLTTAAGVQVFDTGAWTVDHGEHRHYYSAPPGPVGTLAVPDAGAVAGDGKSIAVFSPSGGYASVYRHKDLDAGSVAEAFRITTSPHSGMVVPYAGHFIASVAGSSAGSSAGDPAAAGGVEVRDASDAVVLGRQDCAGLAGHAYVRAGVVFACADGALLVTGDDGAFAAEKIPYPDGGAGLPPATSLGHRPGSNELAGPAGGSGIWHLDVAKRTWTYLPTPVPAVAAAAVGDGKRVLAAGVDGSVLALNTATGGVTARAALLAPAFARHPQLRIDTSRAYVSEPARSRVHEIDYADGLRIARTFDVPAADFLLETGL